MGTCEGGWYSGGFGVVVVRDVGGGVVEGSFALGLTESEGGIGDVAPIGEYVVGWSVVMALQYFCGSPVVPGGHKHTGRWFRILHEASSLQIPSEHAE